MDWRIETIDKKILAGKRMRMSLSRNKTVELWKSFMPGRMEIPNRLSADLYSMQVYDPGFNMQSFTTETEFEKWAAMEVSTDQNLPEGIEVFYLPGGLYAVFLHKGAAATGERTFRYIFETWLPDSGYSIDNRPHFEVLGEKYKNDSLDSEEEIWIPVKPK
jgi:AraC family transcriptional regulator